MIDEFYPFSSNSIEEATSTYFFYLFNVLLSVVPLDYMLNIT